MTNNIDRRLEFIKLAKENGHGGPKLCGGWDWMRLNLGMLDNIFQTREYKDADKMKYKCMPFLIAGMENLDEKDKRVLETAWYLNNERIYADEKAEYHKKMDDEGLSELTPNLFIDAMNSGKQLYIKGVLRQDWAAIKIDGIYRPATNGDTLILLPPRSKRRGYRLSLIENGFAKIV